MSVPSRKRRLDNADKDTRPIKKQRTLPHFASLQFEEIFSAINDSQLVNALNVTRCLRREIAIFSVGSLRHCDGGKCTEKIVVLSQDQQQPALAALYYERININDDNHWDCGCDGDGDGCNDERVYCSQCMRCLEVCESCQQRKFVSADTTAQCCVCAETLKLCDRRRCSFNFAWKRCKDCDQFVCRRRDCSKQCGDCNERALCANCFDGQHNDSDSDEDEDESRCNGDDADKRY